MGSVVISGATSGAVTLAVPDEAGTRTLTLPATTGTILTNDISQAGDTSAGNAAAVGYTSAEGLILTGQGSTSDITFKNDADTTVFSIPTGTDDILFPDGARALFGAGSDLALQHDSSNSYIQNNTGSLNIQGKTGENGIVLVPDGAVTLYHDNAAKLATTATGVDITGAATASTFEPDSDTAAGDNAAIGYTSTEGLILTGQGSTSDVTIKNDADATVLSIATGTTKVGVGTTAPSAQLQVHSAALGTTAGDSQDILQLHSPDTSNNTVYKFLNYRHTNGSSHDQSELRWQRKVDVSNHGYIGLRVSAITFGYGDNTERVRILDNGDTCFASTALGFANQRAVQIQTSSTGLIAIQHLNTEGDGAAYIWFTHNGSAIGSIVQNGTSGITYNTSSDYRLKENVNYTFDATTRLKQLKPARFNFISDEERGTVDGFLAHEVSNVVPNAITGEKDAVDDDGKPIHQQIDHSKLVPLLVKTIQEQQTVIEALETRITALEAG